MKHVTLLLLLSLSLLLPFRPAGEGHAQVDRGSGLDYEALAARIIGALKLREGERVLIRFDPGYFNELVGSLRRRIREAGAVDLGALEYIESAAIRHTAP